MRTYGTIRSTFWMRGSGKRLRGNPEAQVLALYLMTCSQGTMSGIFHLALPTVAHETGIALERIPGLLLDVQEIARYDEDDELCWLPNAAREQLGATLAAKDKKRSGLIRELKQFGSHQFVREFRHLYTEAYGLSECGEDAPSKPLGRGIQAEEVDAEGASKPPGQGQGQGLDQALGSRGVDPPPSSEVRHAYDPNRDRKSGEPPRPRSDITARPLQPEQWQPTEHGLAYAAELGLSPPDIERTLVELRDKHGLRPHDVGWWDTKWARFVEQTAKSKTQRRTSVDDDPERLEAGRRGLALLYGKPVQAKVAT